MPGHRLYKKTVITSHENPPLRRYHRCVRSRFWTSCVSAYATCITAPPARQACPLGSCLHPFPRWRHPASLGQQRSRGISVLAGERAQGFGLHASSGIGGLAVLLRQVLCTGSALALEIGRPRPSRRLPVVLTPDEVVHPRFSGRRASFVRPASVWNGHADRVRVCNCGSGSGFDHGTIIVREGKGSKDRALMLPESLAQPARAAVACTGMVAEGPGRAAAALRFPTPLSGSIRAPGVAGRGSGFLRSTRIRPIHGRCRASPSHV